MDSQWEKMSMKNTTQDLKTLSYTSNLTKQISFFQNELFTRKIQRKSVRIKKLTLEENNQVMEKLNLIQ